MNCLASSTILQDYQLHSEKSPDSEINKYVGALEQPIPICNGINSFSVTNSGHCIYFLHHSRTTLSRVIFALKISGSNLTISRRNTVPQNIWTFTLNTNLILII